MIKVCFAKRVTKDHVKFQEILNANPDDGKKSPKAVPMLSSMASTQESKQVVYTEPLPGHHTRVLAWRMGCPPPATIVMPIPMRAKRRSGR